MKDLNLKPYKPRLLQALNEDDPDRRLEWSDTNPHFIIEQELHVPQVIV
jgi:hypothetical protein